MRQVIRLLGPVVLLLLFAQQGAVVHEIGHATGVRGTQVKSAAVIDVACALCPSFAQSNAAAFSHEFDLPPLDRAAPLWSAEPIHAAVSTAAPRPRSRGPPA